MYTFSIKQFGFLLYKSKSKLFISNHLNCQQADHCDTLYYMFLQSGMKKKTFSHVLVSHITRFFSVFCRGVLHEHVDLGFTQNKYKLKLNIFSYQTKVHIHNYFPLVGPFGTSNDRLQN